MRTTHSWTDDTVTIAVEGLSAPVRMAHITDSHIARIDDRDPEHVEACEKSCQRFNERRHADDGTPIPAIDSFDEHVVAVREDGPDLIALTGDIVHFPAQAGVSYVAAAIDDLGIPFMYTAGNHDWHYPGVDGRDELRGECIPLLKPLHRGSPSYDRYANEDMQWLSVDNSLYQISAEQLAFVSVNLANEMPTVLLMHIPLSLPTLRDDSIARWQAPIFIADPDWDPASRDKWDNREQDLDTTLEFARVVTAAENLVAIFCGHIHFLHADTVNRTAVQYVGAPGFEGAMRTVEFQPLR